ncbi:hypothetical protein C8T65DRAFT_830934 [Cerioporus squamosus]|nr:hypothetical protein C8T65DRAFT_830934 [Cerioporus squamosus]
MSGHAPGIARSPALLPPEILLTIVEQFDGDKETLRSCSLVCHTWLPVSRSQLFRTIFFRPPPKGYPDCFVRFLDFFCTSQHSGSNLGRHVEDLTVMGARREVAYSPYGIDKYHCDSDDSDSKGDCDQEHWHSVHCQLEVLTKLSSVFTRLKRLTLVKLTITDDMAYLRRRRAALGDDRSDHEPRGNEGARRDGQRSDRESEDDEDGGDDQGSDNDGPGWSDEESGSDTDHGVWSDELDSSDSDQDGEDVGSGVEDPIKVLPDNCSPLGELRINEVYSAFHTYRDIFQVICSFSEIGKLALEYMPWNETKRRDSNPATWFTHVNPTHRPLIRTIDLEDPLPSLVRIFHDFLRRSGALEGSLQSFKFRGGMDGMKEIEAFRPLLVDFSSHLRELNLNLWPRMYRKPKALNDWRDIPLSRCTALESLILPVERVPPLESTTPDKYASRVADIVQIYTSWLAEQDSLPALRAVTFEVLLNYEPTYWFEGSREKHHSAWYGMAAQLARRPLERVSIVMSSFEEEDAETKKALKDFFATPMAPLQSKGILNVQFVRQPSFEELFLGTPYDELRV